MIEMTSLERAGSSLCRTAETGSSTSLVRRGVRTGQAVFNFVLMTFVSIRWNFSVPFIPILEEDRGRDV